MKEEYKSDTQRDFVQRFVGTYGWYSKANGNEILVRVDEIYNGKLNFVDSSGFKYVANPDAGNVFSFIPLEKGLHNYNDDVIFCRRVPQRQWKRGICSGNTRVDSLVSNDQIDLTFDLMETVFNPVEKSRNLSKFISSHSGNAALSSSFAVANKKLFVYNICIGNLDGDTFKLTDRLFAQEVQDTLRNLNLDMKVEVK
jgi:hypothetical protein